MRQTVHPCQHSVIEERHVQRGSPCQGRARRCRLQGWPVLLQPAGRLLAVAIRTCSAAPAQGRHALVIASWAPPEGQPPAVHQRLHPASVDISEHTTGWQKMKPDILAEKAAVRLCSTSARPVCARDSQLGCARSSASSCPSKAAPCKRGHVRAHKWLRSCGAAPQHQRNACTRL